MPVASLIARPGHLDAALVDALRNALGGGVITWLSPDEAAEFALEHLPGNLGDIRASIADAADLNVLPDARGPKRLLIADMDSTMIEQECIDELADMAGVGAQVQAITARAMNGELDFEAALIARVALLEGLPARIIDEVIADRITLASGGRILVATMKGAGAHAALVSGGFTAFSEVIGAMLGFDETRANTLEIRDGHLTGAVTPPILGRDAKIAALNEITQALGATPADAIAVGDGANDLGMLGRAGIGIALHAKPSVQAECDIRINHGDLTALLYLQGISRPDFVD